jgi:hypothetical protein
MREHQLDAAGVCRQVQVFLSRLPDNVGSVAPEAS